MYGWMTRRRDFQLTGRNAQVIIIISLILKIKLNIKNNKFNIQTERAHYEYNKMNRRSQVIIGFEFNCRAPIALYISFNERRRLANEGLVNLTGDTGRKLGWPAPHARCYPLLYGPSK